MTGITVCCYNEKMVLSASDNGSVLINGVKQHFSNVDGSSYKDEDKQIHISTTSSGGTIMQPKREENDVHMNEAGPQSNDSAGSKLQSDGKLIERKLQSDKNKSSNNELQSDGNPVASKLKSDYNSAQTKSQSTDNPAESQLQSTYISDGISQLQSDDSSVENKLELNDNSVESRSQSADSSAESELKSGDDSIENTLQSERNYIERKLRSEKNSTDRINVQSNDNVSENQLKSDDDFAASKLQLLDDDSAKSKLQYNDNLARNKLNSCYDSAEIKLQPDDNSAESELQYNHYKSDQISQFQSDENLVESKLQSENIERKLQSGNNFAETKLQSDDSHAESKLDSDENSAKSKLQSDIPVETKLQSDVNENNSTSKIEQQVVMESTQLQSNEVTSLKDELQSEVNKYAKNEQQIVTETVVTRKTRSQSKSNPAENKSRSNIDANGTGQDDNQQTTVESVQLRSNEVSSAKTESQAEVKEYSKNEQQTPTKSVVTRKIRSKSKSSSAEKTLQSEIDENNTSKDDNQHAALESSPHGATEKSPKTKSPALKTLRVGWLHKGPRARRFSKMQKPLGGVKKLKLDESTAYTAEDIRRMAIKEFSSDDYTTMEQEFAVYLGLFGGHVISDFQQTDGEICDIWTYCRATNTNLYKLDLFLLTTPYHAMDLKRAADNGCGRTLRNKKAILTDNVRVYYHNVRVSKYSHEISYSECDKLSLHSYVLEEHFGEGPAVEEFEPLDYGHQISRVEKDDEVLLQIYLDRDQSCKTFEFPSARLTPVAAHSIVHDTDKLQGVCNGAYGVGMIVSCTHACRPVFTWYRDGQEYKSGEYLYWMSGGCGDGEVGESHVWSCSVSCQESEESLKSKEVTISN